MRTTSSLAGSVPTNLACVTASAMFSMASAAASWLASARREVHETKIQTRLLSKLPDF